MIQRSGNGLGLPAGGFVEVAGPKSYKEWRPTRPTCKETKAEKAKTQGNEGPQGQNARKWRPTRPKCKEMKAQKAKKLQNGAGHGAAKSIVRTLGKRAIFGNLWGGPRSRPRKGQNARKWRPTMPKWKEMKAHKAKMQGNEGPQCQNARKWRPTRPKCKEMKAQKAEKPQNGAGHGAAKSIVRTLGKRAIFGNLWGGPQKLTPKRPKCKEMKAHKAKMQGNKGPQGQNPRKWRPTRPKCKEMKAYERPQGQNESPPCALASTKLTTLRSNLRFGVSHSRASCRLQRAWPEPRAGWVARAPTLAWAPRFGAAVLRPQAYGCGRALLNGPGPSLSLGFRVLGFRV